MVPGEAPRIATVLVEGERMRFLAEGEDPAPGTRQIDLAGKHLLPGLIDAYTHFDSEHDALYTAVGVTTVRDVGGDRLGLLVAREPASRDRVPGPRLLTAGALVGGEPPVTPQAVSLRNEHAAEEYLPILFEEQVDFLSIHPGLPESAWRKTLELAHAAGLQVWGPLPTHATLASAVAAGQDGFHFLDGLLPAEVAWEFAQPGAFASSVRRLGDAGVGVVPLLVVHAARLENQGAASEQLALLELLDPSYESWWKAELVARVEVATPAELARAQRVLDKQGRLVKQLAEAGVKLLPGSAGGQPWLFPGQALHRELGLWVRAGMTPEEVLRRATHDAALALGLEDRGSLRDGAVADLVCVDSDPRQDLSVLLDPTLVCVRGRVLERIELSDLLQTMARRQAAKRERLTRPLELAPPPGPRAFGEPGEEPVAAGDVLVLEGQVESRALGQRVSSERFQVWQRSDGRTAFCGRVLYPGATEGEDREVEVCQVLEEGRLERSYVTLSHAGMRFEARGLWAARTWRMSNRLEGQSLSETTSLPVRPRFVDVSSITSLLILGQIGLERELPVVHLREGLEGELVQWQGQLDDKGDHQVRTPLGALAFRLNDEGAPERMVQQRGGALIETDLLSHEAFGGAGLPLPLSKRRARAAAEARAATEAGTGEEKDPTGSSEESQPEGGAGDDAGR